MAKTYLGLRYKLELRAPSVKVQPGLTPIGDFELCFIDGLARAQMMHAYVAILHELVTMHMSAIDWLSEPKVVSMLRSFKTIEVNFFAFDTLADSYHEALRAYLKNIPYRAVSVFVYVMPCAHHISIR